MKYAAIGIGLVLVAAFVNTVGVAGYCMWKNRDAQDR